MDKNTKTSIFEILSELRLCSSIKSLINSLIKYNESWKEDKNSLYNRSSNRK